MTLPENLSAILERNNQSTARRETDTGLPPLSQEQNRVLDVASEGRDVIVEATVGSGKALTNDSRVPTPRGWRLVKDVRVGDELYTPEGVPTRVVGVFPQGVEDVYEVELSDGRVIRCSASHNWWVRRTTRRVREFEVLTTEQMLMAGVMRRAGKFKAARYRIPMHKAIEMPEVELPVDPYVVGAFIGNGSCTEPRLALSSAGSEVPEKVAHILGLTTKRRSQKNHTWDFFTTEGRGVYTKDVLGPIAEFVCHKSGDKQIPDEYLTGSIVQRKELIRGLMDTDGSISSNNRRNVSYSTTSEKLMRGLCDLLGSVGWTAHATTDDRSHKYASKVCYHIGVHVPNDEKSDMFSCGRKAELAESAADLPKRRDYSEVSIVDIRKTDVREEMTCFAVEDESHLFLADNYVVTHNTSTIMAICNALGTDRRILYLTYSKLLKHDAQRRVRRAKVQNYHGIVYPSLLRAGIRTGLSDSIGAFNRNFRDLSADFGSYDTLVIDEYQDINEEYAQLIANIKSTNPLMQIVMVGDTEQKIHANSALDTRRFAAEITDAPVNLAMTQSFRMGPGMGQLLGAAWNKPVVGVNDEQIVRTMNHEEAVAYMRHIDPGDLLVLGKRNGGRMLSALNLLEARAPQRFNKTTVYASIRERGDQGIYDDDTAIFTTFDSSKGLERPVTFVYDMDRQYFDMRLQLSSTDPEIIRNVFLVAASRGKGEIIFVTPTSAHKHLAKELEAATDIDQARTSAEVTIADLARSAGRPVTKRSIGAIPVQRFLDLPEKKLPVFRRPVNPSGCFDHTYAENVIAALELVEHEELDEAGEAIEIPSMDGLIDLSPVIGSYVELMYFEHSEVTFPPSLTQDRLAEAKELLTKRTEAGQRSLWDDALFMTALETEQNRYLEQVTAAVPASFDEQIIERLTPHLPRDARVQTLLTIEGMAKAKRPRGTQTPFLIAGYGDVLHQDRLWELKFTSELTRENFLQAALYLVMSPLEEAVLVNVRTGQRFLVRVPDRQRFLDAVVLCVSKQSYQRFEEH